MSFQDISLLIVSLLTICNPLVNVSIFISLTESYAEAERKQIAFKTSFAVLVILLITTWVGAWLLGILGISLPVLMITGGFVIAHMGLSMLQAETSRMTFSNSEHKAAENKSGSIAVVPLAIPILAGPGTMSVIMVSIHAYGTVTDKLMVSGICLGLSILLWLIFYFSTPISKILGENGQKVLSRVMGLILACIGVTMIVKGLPMAFHWQKFFS